MPKIDELLGSITERLTHRHRDAVERTQDAWWMLEAITKKSEAQLLAQREIVLTAAQQETLERWLDLHVNKKEPIQYLIGSTPFNDIDILCEPPVLIPRPETEEWVINLITLLKPIVKHLSPQEPFRILDLCAGTGCIAIALAKAFPSFEIVATDINPQALALIKKNITHNSVYNVKLYEADLFDGIPKTEMFDLIVSNPPYISESDWAGLDDSVKNWEDQRALVGGNDGLSIIRRIIEETKFWLKTHADVRLPQLVLEMDYYQGPTIKGWLELNGYNDIAIKKDLEGKDRVIYANRV